jgi:hypothetical protein
MLNVKIQSKSIEVGVKGGETIVAGPLHASVQLDECLWLLDKNCVDVTLSKVCALRRASPVFSVHACLSRDVVADQ